MTRVTKAIYEITLGGESTGGDLVVARSPLVASLLVASLPGGEVTVNQYQKFVNYLVLADKFASLQTVFFPVFFELG